MNKLRLFFILFVLLLSLLNHTNGSIFLSKETILQLKAEKNKTIVECEKEGSEIVCNGTKYTKEVRDKPGSAMFIVDLFVCLFCVIFAGIMSGMTLGLLSLDELNLTVIKNSDDPKLKKYATRILPLLKRRHLLLCTLLIGNAAVMETLPIFLDRMVGPAPAIIISVTCVLFFGEIIPQSICSKYGLFLGWLLAPLIWVVIVLVFILAYPISKLLDCILGEDHGTMYKRTELKELMGLHSATYRKNKEMDVDEHCLTDEEVIVIKGALDMQSKTVRNIEVPLEKVSMIESCKILDSVERFRLYNEGYSRIPVYEDVKTNLLGYILVKELVIQQGEKELTPKDLKIVKLKVVRRETRLYDLLKIMREESAHMAVIKDEKGIPTGICTLEDLLEELLQSPIVDEFDSVSVDPGKQLRLARALETLGLENQNRDIKGDFPRQSVDVLLRRRDDHPLTKEIMMRGSLDLRKGRMVTNPESGRISLDLSSKFSTKDNKKGSQKKKKGYGNLIDDELFFDKDDNEEIDL